MRDRAATPTPQELGPAIRRQIFRVGLLAGSVGALVTFAAVGLLIPVVLNRHQEIRLGLINFPVVVGVTLVSQIVVARRFGDHMRTALAWLAEGRDPEPREVDHTLGLANHAVRLEATAWAIAGVGFAVLDGLLKSWSFSPVVVATIWLGGESTCALGYLLYERALRPVTALALAARPGPSCRTLSVRTRLGMAWLLGTGVPLVGLLALGIVGALHLSHSEHALWYAVLFVALVACGTGFLATALVTKAIAEPLGDVRRAMQRVERGELDVDVPVDDGSEIGQLQVGFNAMAEGLRERQRIRELLGRSIGEDVARAALRDGVSLGGEERQVSALFIDLVGSTALAAELSPTDLVALLNRFFGLVVAVVEAADGLVNKFEGDAALCVFGAPVSRPDHAGEALRAARALAARVSEELPQVDFGIGVSAGTCVAGNVGAEQRSEYTVIGDAVNEAARLAELAKRRPERVLASGAVLDLATDEEARTWSETQSETLRGRQEPTRLATPVEVPVELAPGRAARPTEADPAELSAPAG